MCLDISRGDVGRSADAARLEARATKNDTTDVLVVAATTSSSALGPRDAPHHRLEHPPEGLEHHRGPPDSDCRPSLLPLPDYGTRKQAPWIRQPRGRAPLERHL
jgi:hypothetical protein